MCFLVKVCYEKRTVIEEGGNITLSGLRAFTRITRQYSYRERYKYEDQKKDVRRSESLGLHIKYCSTGL